MIRIRPITNVLGILLLIQGLLLMVTFAVGYVMDGRELRGFALASVITAVAGFVLSMYKRGDVVIGKREGYLIVALGWISMILFGSLPYLLTGACSGFADALFESASGFTATGATIFNDIESLPAAVLFWRSLSQWIGGMGIIVLTVAIFPLLGIAGIELFVAEMPGPTSDKIHPRIKDTARILWLIYIGLTVVITIVYKVLGMSFFDAINHAFTSAAIGGFSTKNDSIAHFSPAIQWAIIPFLIIAGTNFTVLYYGLTGKFKKMWRSEEFRFYLLLVLVLVTVLVVYLINVHYDSNLDAARDGIFQIVSILTTTGYVTADYTSWGGSITMMFFLLYFLGACAGSPTGSIKLVRHLVFVKNSFLEFKRLLHPRAVIRIKVDKQLVAPRILTHILVFLLLYMAIFVIGSIFLSIDGMDFRSSMGAVAACLGNVGPGIGSVGPMSSYTLVPGASKVFLSFLMLLGRLELFTILLLLSPYFWKYN